MIQRIQSLFLLLAAVVLGTAAVSVCDESYIFTGIAAVAMLVSVVTIFLYTKRRLQACLIAYTIVLECLAPCALLVQKGWETWREHIVVGVLIVSAIVLSFLARAGVLRDERLVRSADRLR